MVNFETRRSRGLYAPTVLLGIFLAAVLMSWGCGDRADNAETTSVAPVVTEPKHGGTLRVAVVKGHTTFDPHVVNDTADILLTQQTYDSVLTLADSWAPNDDLTKYTFHLRPGVKFHHGKKFTAEDVVFTFNRLLDPELGSPIASRLTPSRKSSPLTS